MALGGVVSKQLIQTLIYSLQRMSTVLVLRLKNKKKDGQDIVPPLVKLSRHWRLHCGDKCIKRQFFGGTFGVLSLTPKAAKQHLTRPKRAKEEIRAMGRQDTPVHRAPATCQAARGARRTHLEPLLQRVRTCPRRVWASSNADT